ncbi:MAG: xylose isomerase [Candidatus Xenobia bacterium]
MRVLGYCLNQFPKGQLLQALDMLTPGTGAGLWINRSLARELQVPGALEALRDELHKRELIAYSLNAFPADDFHGPVVKHRVYHPAWDRVERLEYTLEVAELLAGLLPEGAEGSLSTLPVGWPGTVELGQARVHLARAAGGLRELHERTGHLIHLDLEPEPGCVLSTSADLVAFWQDLDRVYLRVCHDVCHAAVMAEGQGEALERYRRAGIRVGKVQISSALLVPDCRLARPALERLSQDRYLHQCLYERRQLFEDLPDFLEQDLPPGELRVHYHVPVDLLELEDGVKTTSEEIAACLAALDPEVAHLEVETYTRIQPEAVLRRELEWVAGLLQASESESKTAVSRPLRSDRKI